MRDQPWNNPEWNEVRDEAKDAIATAERMLQHADGPAGEKLRGAVSSLENARIRGRMEDIHTATLALRRAADEVLQKIFVLSAEPRNGTSGVTGVENPDGEPDRV